MFRHFMYSAHITVKHGIIQRHTFEILSTCEEHICDVFLKKKKRKNLKSHRLTYISALRKLTIV